MNKISHFNLHRIWNIFINIINCLIFGIVLFIGCCVCGIIVAFCAFLFILASPLIVLFIVGYMIYLYIDDIKIGIE